MIATHIALLTAMACLVVHPLRGQAGSQVPRSARRVHPREATTTRSACPATYPIVARRDDPHIRRFYDRFENRSTIVFGPVESGEMGLSRLTLSYDYPSDTLRAPPEKALLMLGTLATDGPAVQTNLGGTKSILLLDGKQWKVTDAVEGMLTPEAATNLFQIGFRYVRGFVLTRCELLQIAAANTFEGRIGLVEFRVDGDRMESLRDFVRRADPKLPEFIRQ